MTPRFLERNEGGVEDQVSRRTFVGIALGTGAAILTGGTRMISGATSTPSAAASSSWKIGGDLSVNRLGFGAMRLTGDGIWGWPPDRDNALKV
ncbi:MAG TPA: hypothetical protein VGM62_08185, partial [Chthoniobacterales bacterium]